MAIPIQCPHCQRSYKLKNELAGKRVTCSTCRKTFPVPAAPVVSAVRGSLPLDTDALAVAALSDHPATKTPDAQVVAQPTPIRVKCPFCDFENSFDSRFAGKNAPCKNDE